MTTRYLSGFSTFDKEKQNIRRSSHTATSGQTVLNPAQGFDPQALFVYVNGVLKRETTDYTTTGNSTITFTSGLSVNDKVDVVSYVFSNPTSREVSFSCGSGNVELLLPMFNFLKLRNL